MQYYPWMKYVTKGDYFTYKGVKYGQKSIFILTENFYKQATGKQYVYPNNLKQEFDRYVYKDGKKLWHCGWCCPGEYYEITDPDNQIKGVPYPVYYMEADELVHQRLRDGSWMDKIGFKTLCYLFLLLISPLFNQWYLVWTIGLYWYLRTSYIELSKP